MMHNKMELHPFKGKWILDITDNDSARRIHMFNHVIFLGLSIIQTVFLGVI